MTDATDTSDDPSLDELEGSNLKPEPPEGEGTGEVEPEPGDDEATRRAPARLSPRGAEFISRFEGCVLHLYNDPTNNATIGIGHLVHMGPINGSEPPEFRNGITRRRALELLQQDARSAAAAVSRLVSVPLQQHEVDALISFTFNSGEGALQTSTLRRRLNAGERAAVQSELRRWVFSQGKKLPGLVRRREAEGALFTEGKYA